MKFHSFMRVVIILNLRVPVSLCSSAIFDNCMISCNPIELPEGCRPSIKLMALPTFFGLAVWKDLSSPAVSG